eukprot:gene12160-13295_t
MLASRIALRTSVRHSSINVSKRMASGSSYKIQLNIDTTTLKALRDQGYTLYAFKGVKPSSKATLSTVWFALEDYMEENVISWYEEFQGYISKTKADNGAQISMSTRRNMSAGNLATVDSGGEGILTTTTTSGSNDPIAASAYNFYNPSKTIYSCGLTHKNPDGSMVPICATPLNPGNAVPIVPIEKVFFFFSTGELDLGQAYTQATSDGLLLDLTFKSNLTLGYNINDTWQTFGSPQASKQKAQPFFDLWGR